MTASDARALAQHLVQRGDDALASLLAARHIAPTVGWNDAFDAAEALLDPASLDRALVALTGDEVDALSGDGPVPPGPVRDTLHERALIDADGTPYTAVRTALETIRRRGVATASGAVAPPAAEGSDDAGAAERAFASLGSLADILHAALAHPFGRIGAGTLGAADRRRLIEAGIVDDAVAADELVVIAERTGLLSGQDKTWLVTPRGAQWLHSDTLSRWAEVAAALLDALPRGVRRRGGGWLPPYAWAAAYPFDSAWSERAAALRALLGRWALLDDAGRPTSWARDVFAAAGDDTPVTGALDLDALAGLLPGEVDRVYLQNDLTAIAPGPLAPHLDMRLRSVARRESHAQASTYRFTPETIADALTSGESAESLREFLTELSLTGLPQPLAYEIERTARTHGTIRVGPDSEGRTRVTSDDDALLRTLAVDQALRPLGLVPEGADLVTRSGADTAFWMIADARYPVVAVDAGGRRRRLDRHRLASAPPAAAPREEIYAVLLSRLRAAPSEDADAAWLGRELDQAVRARATIVVAVRMPDGSDREFIIEATGLGGGRLRGLDRTVDVERTLPVSSISGIRPAGTA